MCKRRNPFDTNGLRRYFIVLAAKVRIQAMVKYCQGHDRWMRGE
jgi:hypothetical protein